MYCRRCGHALQTQNTICPRCGSLTNQATSNIQQNTFHAPPVAHPAPMPTPYLTTDTPFYAGQGHREFVTPPQHPESETIKNAVITELSFSLFGMFGIGWFMANEPTIGFILLLSSIFLYWPIIIFGTIITYGLGLVCLVPLAILVITGNAIFLQNLIQKKNHRYYQKPQQ